MDCTMNVTATSLQAYRTALVLNNAAVTLLKSGACSEALKTANDALLTFQAVFSAVNAPNAAGLAAEKYQQVMTRISNISKYANRVSVEIHDVEEDEYGMVRSAATYGPSSTVVFPIRICESVTLESGSRNNIARHLGIILYNHGLLHFVCAMQAEDKKARLLPRASRSLRMAHTTFFRLFQKEEETCQELPCVLFAAMALNCLSLVFQSGNEVCKAEEAQRGVHELFSGLFDEQNFKLLFERKMTAAAA